MYWVEPVIDKIGRGPVDGLAGAAAKAVVGKAGCETGATDPR